MTSRKHGKNRNTVRIGIFQGKEALYNQAILEVLREQGSLTTWGVAKSLQNKLKSTTNKEIKQARSHKIYSVIQRKNGRLSELQRKNYIVYENGKWSISLWKGRMALFIKNPQLIERLDMETYRRAITLMQRKLKTPPDKQIELPFGMTLSVNGKQLRKGIEKLLTRLETDPSFIRFLVEETKQLLMAGVDMDLITEENLVTLLAGRKNVQKMLKKLV